MKYNFKKSFTVFYACVKPFLCFLRGCKYPNFCCLLALYHDKAFKYHTDIKWRANNFHFTVPGEINNPSMVKIE